VVKQFKPLTNDPQIYQIAQERFQQEAVVLEKLGDGHKQIPHLYAYFTEEEQFYLVQEFVQGQTLTKRVAEGGLLSEAEARAMLTSLLPVLEYVHQQDIIHRDISPNNIMVRPDQTPVLIDFGAVKEAVGTTLNSQGQPSGSIVVGTPGFMASEQAAGLPIYSSDLYSLALTAIYAMTGKVPQAFKANLATGEIAWRDHAPSCSDGFAAVLNKAIQYHPRDRYPTAAEMLAALQHINSIGTTSAATAIPTPAATLETSPPPLSAPGQATPRSGEYPAFSQPPQEPVVAQTTLRPPDPQPVRKSGGFKPWQLITGLTAAAALFAGIKLYSIASDIIAQLQENPTPIPTETPQYTDTPQVNPTGKGSETTDGNFLKKNPGSSPVPNSSEAGFKICNKTDRTLYSAIAYRNTTSQTWSSEGWWTIKAGACATPIQPALTNRYYYVHGRSDDKKIVWDGDHKFYVTSEAFTITDAEKDPGNGYQEGFFEVDVGDHKSWIQDLCPIGGC
jgi:serine/threonine-protein kinase